MSFSKAQAVTSQVFMPLAFNIPTVLKTRGGYTLVELIVVLLLVAILSAYASSRMSSKSDYSSTITQNQLLASARLAQQAAMARTDASSVSFRVEERSGQWWFSVLSSTTTIFKAQSDQQGGDIYFGQNFVDHCSSLTLLSAENPLVVEFDGDGNRVVAENFRICMATTPARELCLSPSGYLYEGACIL